MQQSKCDYDIVYVTEPGKTNLIGTFTILMKILNIPANTIRHLMTAT